MLALRNEGSVRLSVQPIQIPPPAHLSPGRLYLFFDNYSIDILKTIYITNCVLGSLIIGADGIRRQSVSVREK
jgi:hypothetical protein